MKITQSIKGGAMRHMGEEILSEIEQRKALIHQIYPKTLPLLSENRALLEEFVGEFEVYWFPLFLREKQLSKQISNLAHIEWIVHEVLSSQTAPPSLSNKHAATSLRLNSAVRWLHLSEDLPEFQLKAGPQIVYRSLHGKLEIRGMTALEAFLLDSLEDQLALSLMAAVELCLQDRLFASWGSEKIENEICKLIDQGILKTIS